MGCCDDTRNEDSFKEKNLAGTYMVQNMDSVRSLSRFPIMHYISHKVVSCVLLRKLGFFCQVLPKVDIPVFRKEY